MNLDEPTMPEDDAVIRALLAEVLFDGWTSRALRRALVACGRDPADALFLFAGGATDMIEAWAGLADRDMAAAARATDFTAYRLPGKVRAIIAIRLEQNRPHRAAIGRAVAILLLPRNAKLMAKITARTVDVIWHEAGDHAADFSWYSKRAILAGVYASTLLFWLRDMSDDDSDTLAFLDRRLANVAGIGKVRGKLTARLPKIRAPRFMRRSPSPSA